MCKPKVYLSPAYHKQNNCCYKRPDGNPCYETLHNNEYLDVLVKFLTANGIDWKRGPRRTPMSNEDGTALMIQAVEESNKWGVDVHYVCHTNASTNGAAKGYHPMYYATSERGKELCEIFAKYRAGIYPNGIKCIPRPSDYGSDLYELRKTYATAIYQEHVFHDNADDAAWFHSHMEDVARADCKALCEWFGLTYKEPIKDGQPVVVETPRFGLNYSKKDGFSWYVDGKETTPRGFMDALTSLMEE